MSRKQNPRAIPTRRARARQQPADFELIFDETGRVQLKDSDGDITWSSDDDDDFAEEFDDDFFDGDHADDIIDYLIEHEYLEGDEEIDIVEIDLEESDDGEPIDGEFIPAKR